jgi:hypothetical protein
MTKHAKTSVLLAALVSGAFATGSGMAAEHKAGVWTNDQSVANGVVSARKVVAGCCADWRMQPATQTGVLNRGQRWLPSPFTPNLSRYR